MITVSARSGLWAEANPLPPWDFRWRQRSGSGAAERPSKSSAAGDGRYWLNTPPRVRCNASCLHERNTSNGGS
ncbi:MAG: hypothetical protein ACKO2P_09625 [Planctomycetota bacterium]